MKKHILILGFLLVIILVIICYKPKKQSGFLPKDSYPEATEILWNNREIIRNELKEILKNDTKFSVWSAPNHDYQSPTFTEMSQEQIKNRLDNIQIDTKKEGVWSLFGFILYGETVERGKNLAPKTFEIVNSIPGIMTAGISCLSPHSETKWHFDIDKGFDRIHLALIIPKGDCGFEMSHNKTVEKGEIKRWSEEPIIVLNDNVMHNAWNNTDYPRYVLLVDIDRSYKNKKYMIWESYFL